MNSTILIAEDALMLREMIALDFQEQGATVALAKDGREAVDIMDKQQPALLLLDLLMPRMDGFAVLQHVRKQGYSFPVIILSNLSDPKEEKRCRDLGAKDFLIKSRMDVGDLWKSIKPYIDSSSFRP